MHATLYPPLSVRPSVGRSVPILLFLSILFLLVILGHIRVYLVILSHSKCKSRTRLIGVGLVQEKSLRNYKQNSKPICRIIVSAGFVEEMWNQIILDWKEYSKYGKLESSINCKVKTLYYSLALSVWCFGHFLVNWSIDRPGVGILFS